jgi:ribosomal protein S18 acetylase RimI-like enzyme
LVPDQVIRIRNREAADIDLCVEALAAVHQTSGYPTNWPVDPARWLTPPGTIEAWTAEASEMPIAGHMVLRQLPDHPTGEGAVEVSRLFVIPAARRQGIARALLQKAMNWAAANELDLMLEVTDHLRAAIALYERLGFRLTDTKPAGWTAPDGQPVTLHHYVRSREINR